MKISRAYSRRIKLRRASRRQKKILIRFKLRWIRAKTYRSRKTREINTTRSRLVSK